MKSFDIAEACLQDIEAAGYAVPAVTADTSECDWAYTIGLFRKYNHPEFILIGLDAPLAGAVLEFLAQQVDDGAVFGSTAQAGFGPLHLRFRQVDEVFLAHADWFNLGREILGRWGEPWPRTIQVVWADRTGDFPQHPGDPAWMVRQPLLQGD